MKPFSSNPLRGREGFTLVELMIVVAIVAILAAIAIPNYIGYRWRVARTEAFANLGTIWKMEEAYRVERQGYLTSSWVPSTVPGPSPDPWPGGGNFDTLGFSPKGKVYYRYGVAGGTTWQDNLTSNAFRSETDGVDIVIEAEGDVDGDGAKSQLYNTDEMRNIVLKTTNF